MTQMHAVWMIAVIAGITALLRMLPFFLFPKGRRIPNSVLELSRALPCAVIGMLVVYCLKDISFVSETHALPEIAASAFVILSYLWKKNTSFSILSGTILYMVLLHIL